MLQSCSKHNDPILFYWKHWTVPFKPYKLVLTGYQIVLTAQRDTVADFQTFEVDKKPIFSNNLI